MVADSGAASSKNFFREKNQAVLKKISLRAHPRAAAVRILRCDPQRLARRPMGGREEALMGEIVPLVFAALALVVIMAGAFYAQRATGRSGWVDTIWSFAVGGVGAALALTPVSAAPSGR